MQETSAEKSEKSACHSIELHEKVDQVKSDSQMNRDKVLITATVTKHDNKEVLVKVNINIGDIQLNVRKQQNNQKP